MKIWAKKSDPAIKVMMTGIFRHTPKAAVRASKQPAIAWLLDEYGDELSPVKW